MDIKAGYNVFARINSGFTNHVYTRKCTSTTGIRGKSYEIPGRS